MIELDYEQIYFLIFLVLFRFMYFYIIYLFTIRFLALYSEILIHRLKIDIIVLTTFIIISVIFTDKRRGFVTLYNDHSPNTSHMN